MAEVQQRQVVDFSVRCFLSLHPPPLHIPPTICAMEAEIQLAKDGAPKFVFGQRKDPLRILISRTTDATMDGKHTVDDFLGFMSALIKDDNDIFQQYNIDMRSLFINTFKCMDTRLEGLAELKPEGDVAEKLKARKTNLIAMIKGALVGTKTTAFIYKRLMMIIVCLGT